MKIRTGFVSNSSSSSFTCHVTGDEVTCDNDGYWDRDFRQCVNSHGFRTQDVVIPDKLSKKQKEYLFDTYSYAVEAMNAHGGYRRRNKNKWAPADGKTYDDLQEEIVKFFITDWDSQEECGIREELLELPEWMCPICSMEMIGFNNAVRFMLKEHYAGDRQKLDEAIKNQHTTLKDLEESVNEVKLLK